MVIGIVNTALVLFTFLSDDLELREVHLESFDDHGLYFEISLSRMRGTSVTGSSSPFEYSL